MSTITTQTKRFHHVKLIIHYIKRLFENKKGIIKILVYSSVIDINHNHNKIVKSDWLSTALISALIGQFTRTVRVMPK